MINITLSSLRNSTNFFEIEDIVLSKIRVKEKLEKVNKDELSLIQNCLYKIIL